MRTGSLGLIKSQRPLRRSQSSISLTTTNFKRPPVTQRNSGPGVPVEEVAMHPNCAASFGVGARRGGGGVRVRSLTFGPIAVSPDE